MTQTIRRCHRASMLSSFNQRSLIACSLVVLAGCQLDTKGLIGASETLQAAGAGGASVIVGASLGGTTSGGASATSPFACITDAECFAPTARCLVSESRCVACIESEDCVDGTACSADFVCETASGGGGGQGGTSVASGGGGGQGGTSVPSSGGGGQGGTSAASAGADAGGTIGQGGTSVANAGADSGGTTGQGEGGTAASGFGGSGAVGSSLPEGCATVLTGATPCTSIAPFSGEQQVDGSDSEFCAVSSFELNFTGSAATIVEYNTPTSDVVYPERATVRIAWSASHLHAFIRVLDENVVPAADLPNIWDADGIDLLITTNRTVTGSTDDDASAMHLIVAPGSDALPGLASSVKTSGTAGVQSALPAEQFVTTTDSAGYVVELMVPWPNGATVSASQRMYFDFTLNSAGPTVAGNGTRDAQAILYRGSLGPFATPSPCGTPVYPYCDDRVWCPTKLE